MSQEIHYTSPTVDGWRLRLFRYPAETSEKAKTPVILCHGLASNRYAVDFGEYKSKNWYKYSLAAFLSNGGENRDISFDVWVAELRGRGDTPTFSPNNNPEKYIWCVDDYIDKDIPMIIKYVQEWYKKNLGRNSTKVFWIGKSMGGMIAYTYGEGSEGRNNLKGVVTLGSPTTFKLEPIFLKILTRLCPRRIAIPINAAELLNNLPELKRKLIEYGTNRSNTDPEVIEEFIDKGMNVTISSKVLNHFSIFFRHHTFCRYPRNPWIYDILGRIPYIKPFVSPYSYTDNLYRFTSPLLAIGGAADTVAPPYEIYYNVKHVGSRDKSYIILSKKNGYRYDYGHLDLTLGKYAREDVYPIIYRWLVERD